MKTTLTFQIPAGLLNQSTDTRAAFQRNMLQGIHSGVDALVADVQGQTPYPSIAQAYGTQDHILPNGVGVSIGNSSPIWLFREYDTKPHWAPFGPGTSLANWSEAHGIKPFLVARKISLFGTQGNHLFGNTFDRYQTRLGEGIQEGLRNFMLEVLGGPANA